MASHLKKGDKLFMVGKHRTLYGEVIDPPTFDSVSVVGPPIYYWEATLLTGGGRTERRMIVAGKSGEVKFIIERNGETIFSPKFRKEVQR